MHGFLDASGNSKGKGKGKGKRDNWDGYGQHASERPVKRQRCEHVLICLEKMGLLDHCFPHRVEPDMSSMAEELKQLRDIIK